MKKILRVDFTRFNHSLLCSFGETFSELIQPLENDLLVQIQTFKTILNEIKSLNLAKESPSTNSLSSFDAQSDESWTAFNLQLKASLHHPKEEVRKTAQKIEEIFRSVRRPAGCGYYEKYGYFRQIILRLSDVRPSEFTRTHLKEFYKALEQAVSNFLSAQQVHIDETANTTVGRMALARAHYKETFTQLSTLIESLSINGSSLADGIIDRLNVIIKQFRQAAQIKSRDKKDHTESPEAIPEDLTPPTELTPLSSN